MTADDLFKKVEADSPAIKQMVEEFISTHPELELLAACRIETGDIIKIMNKPQITKLLDNLAKTKERNIVAVDFANVYRWVDSLGWPVGVRQNDRLVWEES